jgi:hypothetical protein
MIPNTCLHPEPEWNEVFQLGPWPKGTPLIIEVYDHDLIGHDDFMGKFEVSEPSEGVKWYHLSPRSLKDVVSGEVQIALRRVS